MIPYSHDLVIIDYPSVMYSLNGIGVLAQHLNPGDKFFLHSSNSDLCSYNPNSDNNLAGGHLPIILGKFQPIFYMPCSFDRYTFLSP